MRPLKYITDETTLAEINQLVRGWDIVWRQEPGKVTAFASRHLDNNAVWVRSVSGRDTFEATDKLVEMIRSTVA